MNHRQTVPGTKHMLTYAHGCRVLLPNPGLSRAGCSALHCKGQDAREPLVLGLGTPKRAKGVCRLHQELGVRSSTPKILTAFRCSSHKLQKAPSSVSSVAATCWSQIRGMKGNGCSCSVSRKVQLLKGGCSPCHWGHHSPNITTAIGTHP